MMVKQRLLRTVFAAGIGLAGLIPTATADPVKKATELALYRPIEIPGMVLTPGNYVVKVPDPSTHADMVGFYNEDQSQLIKLVRTLPAFRAEATANTVFTFAERAKGAPAALNTWFYPGDRWGKQFVYGKAEPVTTAREGGLPDDFEAPTPEEVEGIVQEAAPAEPAPGVVAEAGPGEAPAPVEVAQAAPAPARVEEPAAVVEELPKTAGVSPVFALLGVSALALGGLVGFLNARPGK